MFPQVDARFGKNLNEPVNRPNVDAQNCYRTTYFSVYEVVHFGRLSGMHARRLGNLQSPLLMLAKELQLHSPETKERRKLDVAV